MGLTAVRRWRARGLTALLPSACAHCRRPGHLICDRCLSTVPWVRGPLCQRCGRPSAVARLRCAACRAQSLPLRSIRAAVHFHGPVPAVIHHFKYRGGRALSRPLSDWLVQAWPAEAPPFDLLLPLPLHRERQRQRGYNQAALLARHLADAWGKPCDEAALFRRRRTRPQATLAARAREENVRGAFSANAMKVADKAVLLIDDVYTTGATLAAAATALRRAGAAMVLGYCVAQAAD